MCAVLLGTLSWDWNVFECSAAKCSEAFNVSTNQHIICMNKSISRRTRSLHWQMLDTKWQVSFFLFLGLVFFNSNRRAQMTNELTTNRQTRLATFFSFFTCRTRFLFLIVCCFQFNNLFASIQNVKIDFDRRKTILKERNKYCNHVWNLFNTNKLIAYAPVKPPAVNIDLIALHVFSQCPVAFPFVSF